MMKKNNLSVDSGQATRKHSKYNSLSHSITDSELLDVGLGKIAEQPRVTPNKQPLATRAKGGKTIAPKSEMLVDGEPLMPLISELLKI